MTKPRLTDPSQVTNYALYAGFQAIHHDLLALIYLLVDGASKGDGGELKDQVFFKEMGRAVEMMSHCRSCTFADDAVEWEKEELRKMVNEA